MNSGHTFHFLPAAISGLCVGLMLMASIAGANDLPTALSVDNCADQYLLALAEHEQIIAVSQDAQQDFSYHAAAAQGLPRIHASSEELIALRPDVVVSSWGWPAQDRQLPEQYGVAFVQMQFGHSPEIIAANLRRVALALNRSQAAEAIIVLMEQRLARAQERAQRIGAVATLNAAYVTPSGATSGGDTLVDSIIRMSGLRNVVAEHGYEGWRYLDLEQLVSDDPDLLVASFFELGTQRTDNWSISRHNVMRQLLANKPVVYIPSRYLGCSAWYFLDAVELIQDQVESGTVATGMSAAALVAR
jgi:iron complex transport system substrate-binding protein